jgi:hypothetical protein
MDLRAKMRQLGTEINSTDGVPAIHFVYGFKQVEPFPFYALMAVLSAQAYHPRAKTFFFVCHEPTGPFWDIVKERVKVVKVPDFDWIGVARVYHYAHKADIIRMLALHDIGGLYLDCDTITLRSMNELANHDFVLGVQQTIPGAKGGFCNAIMMGRRQAPFAARWLESHRAFDSKGRDLHWDFHSVKLPMYLYSKATHEVHVLAHDKWFFPLWNHIHGFLFARDGVSAKQDLISGQYAIHLWHNMHAAALDTWSPERMLIEPCLYSALCLEALSQLPSAECEKLAQRLNIVLSSKLTNLTVAPS